MFLVVCSGVQAQKKQKLTGSHNDSLATYRAFVRACNLYQQLPLYLEMELVNTTNFVTSEEDTVRMQSTFYMVPGMSYIRFGDAEQFVSDSIALLVSDKLQRMIVYSRVQPLLRQMQAIVGMQWTDSSLQQMAQRFIATTSTTAILLTGRDLLYGTSFPKESVELQYNPATQEPVKVITIKRNLLPVSEADVKVLREQGMDAGKVLVIEGKGQFLIKEQTGTFIYKKIMHTAGMTLPATIADRIVKNEQGRFTPVKAYESYAITLN
jgi:hypothetical protein